MQKGRFEVDRFDRLHGERVRDGIARRKLEQAYSAREGARVGDPRDLRVHEARARKRQTSQLDIARFAATDVQGGVSDRHVTRRNQGTGGFLVEQRHHPVRRR